MKKLAAFSNLTGLKRWAWILVFLVGVPALGVGTAAVLDAIADTGLQSKLARGSASPALAKVTVARLCRDERASGGTGSADCVGHDRRRWLRIASVSVGALGVGWVGLILLAGRIARRDRRLLLWAFRPGLYLTGLIVATIVLAHAALVTAVVVMIFGRPVGVGQGLGVIGFGACVGAWTTLRLTFRAVRSGTEAELGRTVTREEAPDLWRRVDAIAGMVGAQPPDQILLTLDATFFVTEIDIDTPRGRLTGRTLCCSLSLARILTVRELEAVIAHEMAHFSGEDTAYTTRFYPIHRGTSAALQGVQQHAEGLAALSLLPAIALLGLFVESFELARFRLARQRELAADAAGARVGGVQVVASMLVKVHAFPHVWERVVQASIQEMWKGGMFANMAEVFADTVYDGSTDEALQNITEQVTSHPTDTHPPLAERLQALGVTLQRVRRDALATRPETPASTLLRDFEALEREQSDEVQRSIAQQIGILGARQDAADAARAGREEPDTREKTATI